MRITHAGEPSATAAPTPIPASNAPATTWPGGLAADERGRRDDHRSPLVLLHGLTFDRTTWQPVLAELDKIDPGRRVLAIDLPGHGQSPEQESYWMHQVVDQIHQAVLDAGMQAPVLAGHSLGAFAASVYGARYPVSGIVSVDQPLQALPFAELLRSLRARLTGPDFPAAWRLFYDSFHAELLPPAAEQLVRSTCRPRQQVVLGYWAQVLDRPAAELAGIIEQTTTALRQAAVRYVYLAGEEPPPGYRDWLGDRLPEAMTEVWPRSGHFPHLARPAQFAQLLAETARWPALAGRAGLRTTAAGHPGER